MALSSNPRVWQILAVIFLLLTGVFFLGFYFSPIFITLVVGIAFLLITEKISGKYDMFMKKHKVPKWRRRLYGYVLFLICLFIILYFLGNSVTELKTAFADFSEGETISSTYVMKFDKYIPTITGQKLIDEASIQKAEAYIFSLFKDFFSKATKLLLNAIILIPLLFYIYFRKKEAIKNSIYNSVPRKLHAGFVRAAKDICHQLHQYLGAKVLESAIIGVLCCAGFFLSGLKGWLILGLIAGFLNIVPYFGPIIGAIPAILIALLNSPTTALFVIITIGVSQIIDMLYLVPFMISNKVKIDPFLTIILILVGAQLLGPLGMIFAIPIFLVYKIVLRESHEELVKIYKG